MFLAAADTEGWSRGARVRDEDDESGGPDLAEQPGAHLLYYLDEQREAGECPILSHLLWHCMKFGVDWPVRDANFINLWRKFGSWDAVRTARRDEQLVVSKVLGTPRMYPAAKAKKMPGDGVDPNRAGKVMLYAEQVKACTGRAGNGGIIACTLQDVLENVQAHSSSNGQLSLQWLRALSAQARREALHDLTLIKGRGSKTVTLVCNFIKTLGDETQVKLERVDE